MKNLNMNELQSINGGCLLWFLGAWRPAPMPKPQPAPAAPSTSTDVTVDVTVDVTTK